MKTPSITRRDFLLRAAAAAVLPGALAAAPKDPPARWPIGCLNRPWKNWSYDQALDGIKAAGYQWTGLLSTTKADPLNDIAATPDYLATLKQRIAARGLQANMGALRIPTYEPLAVAIANTRQQIENAHTLRFQRPGHGRELPRGWDAGGNRRQCQGQPAVSGKGAGYRVR